MNLETIVNKNHTNVLLVSSRINDTTNGDMQRLHQLLKDYYPTALVYELEEALFQLGERDFSVIIAEKPKREDVESMYKASKNTQIFVLTEKEPGYDYLNSIWRLGMIRDVVRKPITIEDVTPRIDEAINEYLTLIQSEKDQTVEIPPQLTRAYGVDSCSTDCLKIIGGLTAAGKTRLSKQLVKRLRKEGLPVRHIMKDTTRNQRAGEIHGKDLRFISSSDFDAKETNGEFAVTYPYSGQNYGLDKSVEDRLNAAKEILLLPITPHEGFKAVALKYKCVSKIFLYTPKHVLEERIKLRRISEDEKTRRLQTLDTQEKKWVHELNTGTNIRYIIDNTPPPCNGESKDFERVARLYSIDRAVDKIARIIQFEQKHPFKHMKRLIKGRVTEPKMNALYMSTYINELTDKLFGVSSEELIDEHEKGAEIFLTSGKEYGIKKKVLYVHNEGGVLTILLQPFVQPAGGAINEKTAFLEDLAFKLDLEKNPEYKPKEKNLGDSYGSISEYSFIRVDGLQISDGLFFSLTDREKLARAPGFDRKSHEALYRSDAPLSGLSIGFVDIDEMGHQVSYIKPHEII